MELRTIKTASEAKLKGITVEIERRDGAFTAVTLRDEDGNLVRVAKTDYSSLGVFIPSEPKLVTKYRIQGDLAGVPVNEVVEGKYAGEDRLRELSELSHRANVELVETKETEEIPF